MFVGNLSPLVTDALLYSHFVPYGPIETVRIMYNTFEQKSRGFGWVVYNKKKSADDAIQALNNTMLLRYEIKVCAKRINQT